MTISKSPSAKERLIATAYDLFTRRGISDVGVDEIVAKAGVAKATLYKYFPQRRILSWRSWRNARNCGPTK